MTKAELIEKIEEQFGSGLKFFRYLGYKHPHQSWYAFRHNNRVDLAMVRIIEIYEEFERLKEIIK